MRGIMFRNSNGNLEKELAAEDYRAHPVRKKLAVFAVTMTTILLVLAFTVGFDLVNTLVRSGGAAPGPGADSAMVYGDEGILERVRELPQVDWAAYAKRCSSTYLHNKEFSGLDVRLFAADEVHYDKNMIDLIKGEYPKNGNEILLSDTMSERLGLKEEVGISYELKVVVQKGEEEIEQAIPMTVCGYYQNPLSNVKDIYEEIYTDESFIDIWNPELQKGYDHIYVKLNNLNPFKLGRDKEEKLEEVNTLSGGNGRSYKMSNLTVMAVLPMILIILCIMLCGYFFIYNIFDISIVNDIRFYGELKTIGMTAKQLRGMLLWQMNRIAISGICLGSFAGCIAGRLFAEAIIQSFAENLASFYQPAGTGRVLLFSTVFTWFTVFVSTMKPFKIASGISPVEAARYAGKRKKGVFSVVSFAFSGILFLVVYTMTVGYSVEEQVARHNETDFRIRHKGTIWSMEEAYQPISQELIRKLENLSFAEDFRVNYAARTKPDYYIYDGMYFYEPSQGEISPDGEVARDMRAYRAKCAKEQGNDYEIEKGVSKRGNCRVSVAGIEPDYLDAEGHYYTVLEGEIDAERFAEGNYLIYNRSLRILDVSQSEKMADQIHAGDKVNVTFFDDAAERYVEKQFIVMALVSCNDMFGNSNTHYSNIWITNDRFKDIYSDYKNLAGSICFNTSERVQDETFLTEQEKYEAVRKIVEEDGNLQLQLDSVWQDRVYYTQTKQRITAFGMLLALIVGLIGIANMVNTVTTDVLVRRVEYAAMQAVGMTGRQMRGDIFKRYAAHSFLSLIIAAVLGTAISYMAGSTPSFTFSIAALGQALTFFFVFSVLLCLAMSRLLTKMMNKKSVVERLRESV